MSELLPVMGPELILVIAAGVLMLLGISRAPLARQVAPVIAMGALLLVLLIQLLLPEMRTTLADPWGAFRVFEFAQYIKLISAAVGVLLVLLAWPSNEDGTAGNAIEFGHETSEFFGLMLLSIAGIFLVAGANDMILLFLGIELASIPTYIMVSISRPLPMAQEAGVKYFFLGALSAAIMLFGFSYLYGTTGSTSLFEISDMIHPRNALPAEDIQPALVLTKWQMLAVVMLLAGFCFKIAAVPLHVYAADVYQGAATPVTAFLAFVPKASGMVAIIKLLYTIGGEGWDLPVEITKLLWIVAALTMTMGNILAVVQEANIKRILAYSSVAHSGYMLVGLTALISGESTGQRAALQGVLFYLASYGIMSAAAFGVLQLIPARRSQVASSAETFDDIAGVGRQYPLLGLAMAVSCFSLAGIPLTVGFFGKLYLIAPALQAGLFGLVVILAINAAISAAYYLRIVATMFLPTDDRTIPQRNLPRAGATHLAVVISCVITLTLGIFVPFTDLLASRAQQAVQMDVPQGTSQTVDELLNAGLERDTTEAPPS